MMKSSETQSILIGPTSPIKPVHLDRIFEEFANSTSAERDALIFEDNGVTRVHTYSELDAIANRLARFICDTIKDNNLKPNSDSDYVIAVSILPTDYLVIILLAIWKSGAAYLPLDADFPKQRVRHILVEAKPVVVIYDDDDGEESFKSIFHISLSDLLDKSKACLSSALNSKQSLNNESETAIILYTSGSTGVPKGVRLSHNNILNRLKWQYKEFPYSKTEEICIFKTALTFGDGIAEIWGPLLYGLALFVVPKGTTQNPEILVNLLEKYKIERLILVPSLLKNLIVYFQINDYKSRLPHLRTWICSGETLSKSLVIEFFKQFSSNEYRLCNFYGSTELTADVTYYVISNVEQLEEFDTIPIGKPIDNTSIYLMDSDLCIVDCDKVGELCVAGLNLSIGYVNGRDSEKYVENTEAKDLIYRTGDYARIQNNILLYEGRIDSQIKIRGQRVDISEVENVVNAIEGIDAVAVLCYKCNEPNQTILAFVTTKTSLTAPEITNILNEELVRYMVPQVILVDEIPLLINGKTDRNFLLQCYEEEILECKQEFDFTGIQDKDLDTAKVLFETIVFILNKPTRNKISKYSNFYAIGGTSLNSILTVSALKDRGYSISIEDFLASKNLGELLDAITFGRSRVVSSGFPYSTEVISDKHERDVLNMLITSFSRKSEWAAWIDVHSFEKFTKSIWKFIINLDRKYSFVVNNQEGVTVGTAINFDARNEPAIEVDSHMSSLFEFSDRVQSPLINRLLSSKHPKILRSFMMGTVESLTPKENVAVIHYMEQITIDVGKSNGFDQIYTNNINPLTQQLCTDIHNYETLLKIQANKYVARDGSRPFYTAPDSFIILLQRKMLMMQ